MQDELAIFMTLNYLTTFYAEIKNIYAYQWPYTVTYSRISSK